LLGRKIIRTHRGEGLTMTRPAQHSHPTRRVLEQAEPRAAVHHQRRL
jgi:hypothetical protein